MATTLNHLKKGESLENKQLVVINSNERDKTDQDTNSFTYTFDKPIKRVSKMDVIYTKIPKSFYNVNNDNATMSVTTQTYTETTTDELVVDDIEIKSGNLLATNIVDGTVVKSNQLTSIGDVTISTIVTRDSFIYISGKFCNIMDFKNFTGASANKPITNIGICDLFIAKFSLDQELVRRWKIGGLVNENGLDIYATSDYLFTTGCFNSFPLNFYNQFDVIKHSLQSDGNPTAFVAKYSLTDEFEWGAKITGVNRNLTPVLVTADEINQKIYVTGSFDTTLDFYNTNDSNSSVDIISIPYTDSGNTNIFIAQYDYEGALQWVSTLHGGCVVRSIVMNDVTLQPIIGVEFFDTIKFSTEYSQPTAPNQTNLANAFNLELVGNQNLAIVEFTTTGNVFDRMRIGGSNFESDIKMDVNNNMLAITGLYNSNPINFYDNSDSNIGFLNINGIDSNIFIAKYSLAAGKTYLWSVNIHNESNGLHYSNVSMTNKGDVLAVGNYTSLLKFNDINGLQLGNDLINNTLNGFAFLVKYDSDGVFEHRSYIKTSGTSGVAINTNIDAHSNNTIVVGHYNTQSIQLYNSDDTLDSTIIYPDTNPSKLNNCYIISYTDNINNYKIDITTLDKRIICKTLIGTDLNYVINMNAFSQQLGLSESTKLNAMIFGSQINWQSLDISGANNKISIEFHIGDIATNRMISYVYEFVITKFANYRPANVVIELNDIMLKKLTTQTDFVFTQTTDILKYDHSKQIFYVTFNINGTFKILTPVGHSLYDVNGLNLSLTTSDHCVIVEKNLIDETPIEINDGSKLTIKVLDNVVYTRFNNASFSEVFADANSSSGMLTLNTQLDKHIELTSGSHSDNLGSDIQVNDVITFDSPWQYGDPNKITLKSALSWKAIASSLDNIFLTAVVDGGNIYISKSSGESWIAKEFTRAWQSVALSQSGKYQTAVADNGQIYVSNSSGVRWTSKESSREWRCVDISRAADSTDGKHQSAVVNNGLIYISHDFGETWVARGNIRQWLSISMDSSGVYQVAVEFGGSIYYSTNSGFDWALSTAVVGNWQSIKMSNDGTLTAAIVGSDNVYYSTDKGATFGIATTISKGIILTDISIANNNTDIQTVVGNTGSIYRTIDGGVTWGSNRTHENWSSVTLSDDGLYQTAVVSNGGIYQSVNTGLDWVEIRDSAPWLAVAISSNGEQQMATYVGGTDSPIPATGSLWQSMDSGFNWVEVVTTESPHHKSRQGGLAMSANGVYRYYTHDNGIVRSEDSGNTWIPKQLGVVALGICVSVDGRHVTIGVISGQLQVSNDFGVTFTSKGPSAENRYVNMSADGSIQMSIVSDTTGKLYITKDYWATYNQPLTSVTSWRTGSISLDGNVLIASGVNTDVYLSTDRGDTWIVNSEFTSSETITDFSVSQDGSVITAIRPNKPLFISIDKGASFQEKEPVREYQSISISLTGKTQTVVVNGGYIYGSNDYGDTWSIRQHVFSEIHTSIAWQTTAISRNGIHIVAASASGALYISSNSGNTLIEVTGESRLWTSVAISDDGQKIVGLYKFNDTSVSGVQTSWDGGITFFTTDPANALTNNIHTTEIAMSGSGSVVMFVGSDANTPNNNVFISFALIAPTTTYDTSWSLDASRYTGSTAKYPTCSMNSDGKIRYIGAGETDFGGTGTMSGLLKWVDSSLNPQTEPAPYDTWYDTGFNGDVQQVTCSDTGTFVTVGITNSKLKVSNDSGIVFSGSIGPTIDGYAEFPKVRMSGDSLVQAVVSKTALYVTYDYWASYHQHRVDRNRVSLGLSADGQIIITGESPGWLYQSFDKGETFGVQQTNRHSYKVAINATGERQIHASSGRELYTSNTFGHTWDVDGPSGAWSDIDTANNASSEIAVQAFGLLYVNDPNAVPNWIIGGPSPATTARKWTTCAVSGDGSFGLAAVENGLLYISSGSPLTTTWVNSGAGTRNWSSCCINDDGGYMAAAVYGGNIYVSNDSGVTWAMGFDNVVRNWVSISVSDAGFFIAADYDGLLYESPLGHDSTSLYPNIPRKWQDVAISQDGSKSTAVALNSYIHTLNFKTLEQRATLKNWVSVSINSDGSVQSAVEFGGDVYTSTDGGVSWSVQIDIKELTSVSINSVGDVQVVVESGGLIYVSTDSGVSWGAKDRVRAWRGVDINSDGSKLAAIVYGDTVYESTNSGNTWSPESLPQPNNNLVDISMNSNGNVILTATHGAYLIRKYNSIWLNVGGNNINWTGVAVSSLGDVQYATAKDSGSGNMSVWKSVNYGTGWDETSSPKLHWNGVDTSGDGSVVTAITTGDQIYVSIDSGINWIARDEVRNWNGISIDTGGANQIASVDTGHLYISTDTGVTWVAKESQRDWRSVDITGDGKKQIACDVNRVLLHEFELDRRITFTIDSINSDISLFDNAHAVETATSDLVVLNNYDLSKGLNFTVSRTSDIDAQDIYIPPGNYTYETLVDKVNELILAIDSTWVTPTYGFSYDSITGKVSFISKISGNNILVSTELLYQMGYTNTPTTLTAGIPTVANNSANLDMSGPLNMFIKSDTISGLRKNKTAYSTNKKLENLIAPLELNDVSNIYGVNEPVEIFLSKKETIESVDIQVVDESGNIINLNGGNVQVNFYFYSS
jgi:hypothetical protein